MAHGVLIADLACEPDRAWETLVTVCQRSNIKQRDVAEAITSAAAGNPTSAVAQEQVTTAVQA
ncbi:ANTAR domain-containing protein [Streptomyces sp. NBC_00028]|uniref:ANTAR domain-containing protein n=1 Tax=Streptomyces sp. NBC_00028 TaxID=2975624 RepID=UPI003251685C